MLTLDDIRSPRNESGFKHVKRNGAVGGWCACFYRGTLDAAGRSYQAPRRSSVLEAARDALDYLNEAGLPESHRVHRRGRPDRLMSCGQMWSDQHPVAGKVGRSDAAERQRLNPEQDQIDAMEPFMRRVAADLDPGIWALSEAKASAGRAAVGAALGQLFLGLAEQELEDGREVGQFFIELPEDPAPHVEQLLDYLGERFIPITVVTAVEATR